MSKPETAQESMLGNEPITEPIVDVVAEVHTDTLPSIEEQFRQLELKAAEHYDAWLRAKAEGDEQKLHPLVVRDGADAAAQHRYRAWCSHHTRPTGVSSLNLGRASCTASFFARSARCLRPARYSAAIGKPRGVIAASIRVTSASRSATSVKRALRWIRTSSM